MVTMVSGRICDEGSLVPGTDGPFSLASGCSLRITLQARADRAGRAWIEPQDAQIKHIGFRA
jgi:hypothetical protein